MTTPQPAVLAVLFLAVVGCEKTDPYPYSAATALRVNAKSYDDGWKHVSEVAETFGAPGPYRHSGGYVGFVGRPFTFKVRVDGVWEKRTYEAAENEFFHAQSFENEAGDGYMIVRKATVRPDDVPEPPAAEGVVDHIEAD